MRTPALLLFLASAPIALALGGCHTHAIDDRADAQLTEIYASGERAAIYPTCADHSPIGANCGLYTRRASTEEFRALFREKKCAGRTDEECQTLYQRAIDAWLERRYTGADWHGVALTCDANPGHCDDPVSYELLLLDSHNRAVRDATARADNEIEAGRRAAHRHDVEQAVATTTAIIGTAAYLATTPKCRSYPSVVENVTTTICAP